MAGLASNIRFKQNEYTVQTEDKRPAGTYIETAVYKNGKIMASRKFSYAAYLNDPGLKKRIENLIKKQHSECIQKIREGKYHSD